MVCLSSLSSQKPPDLDIHVSEQLVRCNQAVEISEKTGLNVHQTVGTAMGITFCLPSGIRSYNFHNYMEKQSHDGILIFMIDLQWCRKIFLNRGAIKILCAKCAENF